MQQPMQQPATQALAALTQDSSAGAVELAERAADLLIRTLHAAPAADLPELRSLIADVGWSLIRAHPTMAPLVNLINTLLWCLEAATSHENRRSGAASLLSSREQRRRRNRDWLDGPAW